MLSKRIRSSVLGVAALLPVVTCGSCMETLSGRQVLGFLSEEEEVTLGAQAFDEILSSPEIKGRILRSGSDYQTVNRIAQRISAVAAKDEPSFQWDWVVIDDPETVNAFCLPGGKIAVYTGIMRVAGSDDELAAVVGHEVAHATNHHGNKRVSQSKIMEILSDVGGDVAGLQDSEKQSLFGLLGVAANLTEAFSRDDEREADLIGLKYLIEAGYNPEAAITFWEKMVAMGGAGGMEFLSTHPSSGNRVEFLRKALALYRERGNAAWRFDLY